MICRSLLLTRRGQLARLIVLTAASTWLGCGFSSRDHPPVYPIKGKVLYQGRPISGGVVVFELEGLDAVSPAPESGGGPLRATGRIEPDGSFRLMAYPGSEGVPAGTYKVGISSMPPRTEGNLFDSAAAAKKGNPDVLRGRYSDPKTSTLTARVVKDDVNEVKFDLK